MTGVQTCALPILYEPVHGSAPDIAGQNKANPIAMIDSVAMMFRLSFNMDEAADMIESAIAKTLEQGYRTADIFSDRTKLASTSDITDVLIRNLD